MLKQLSNIEKKAKRYFIKNTREQKYELDQKKINKQFASMVCMIPDQFVSLILLQSAMTMLVLLAMP